MTGGIRHSLPDAGVWNTC